MRVLILSRRGIARAFTGDSTQMRQTIACVRPLVESLSQVFVDSDGKLYDHEDRPQQETLNELCLQHDVVHQLPRLNFRAHGAVQAVLQHYPTVISTVFWYGLPRVRIAWRNHEALGSKVLAAIRAWRAGSKRLHDYRKGCDVLLPNSWAEGENVMKHFQLSPGTFAWPICNAFNVPSFDVQTLPKPSDIPFDDYIVCPAAFASRKNQLGLIRALRELDVPLVFMGDPLESDYAYWKACQRNATSRMVFLPHRDNRGADYWAVLRHARCACLPADCETPGIALLEAAFAGARPVVTKYGGTQEYYGMLAEYLDPVNPSSIRQAVLQGWERGRLGESERCIFAQFSWIRAAVATVDAYRHAIRLHGQHMNP